MNKELLIQYVDFLNKIENIPYDVNMSRNDLDYSIIQFIEKKASEDEELFALLSKIKVIPSSDRIEFINHYFDENEVQESNNNQTEEEIAKVFSVDIQDIHHLFLANGNEVFSFYSSKFNRNIVLENLKHGQSLHEQLEEIQKNNEIYQSDDSAMNAQDIMNEEVSKNQIELAFYTKEELQSHKFGVDMLSDEDKAKLTYLINHYDELNIVGINISNMIYIDDKGTIHEATIDHGYNIYISQPASDNTSFNNENVENNNSETNNSFELDQDNQNSDTNNELDDMLSEEESINESKLEQYEKDDKPKVLVKKDFNDDSYGFVNNALYLFILLLVVIICIILFLVFYKF